MAVDRPIQPPHASRTPHRHMPALDGLRALAVGAVIAYHLGLGWAGGGYLGVDLFFVLSGFLITGLLVAERDERGHISLRAFWARRARRLLPALFVMLVAISAYAAAGGVAFNRHTLRGDGLAALTYVANWHFLAAHRSYFSQFSSPSPLEHTWSLAIEEQFYIVWPLVVAAVMALAGRAWKRALGGVTAVIAAASVAAMAILARGAADPSRAYFGTDARAFELLIGAGLALVLAGRTDWTPRRPGLLQGAGAAAAALLVIGCATLGGPPAWMFQGGFLLAALGGALVVLSVSRPAPGPLGKALSMPALRYAGRISYGLYLFHWPVFRLLGPALTALPTAARDVVLVAVTFAVAAVSYRVVETPARNGVLAGWPSRVVLPAAVGATATAILVASLPAATAVAAAPPTAAPVAAGFRLARKPTPADPLRVLVIGDSVMNDTEPALAAMLESTGVVRVTNVAAPWWGLTRSKWAQDWPALIARIRPEVVVGTWGWDIAAAEADPAGYVRTLDSAVSVLLADASEVVLLQYPRMGPHPGFDAAKLAMVETDRERWNSLAADEAAAHPGRVAYLAVAGALEVDGRYSTWLPGPEGRWSRARMIDDLHPCPTGAARLAAAVVGMAGPGWRLPPAAPQWWKGAWVHDRRFDDPPGSCPDDQPPS